MAFNAEELLASLTSVGGGGDNQLMPSSGLNLVDSALASALASALKKFSVGDRMDLSIAPGAYPEDGDGINDNKSSNQHPYHDSSSTNQHSYYAFPRSSRSEGVVQPPTPAELTLTANSRQEIMSLNRQCPINHKERQELNPLPPTFLRQPCAFMGQDGRQTSGRINSGIPQKVPPITSTKYQDFRKTLPIWGMRNQIIQSIWTNQVIVIAGASGSGKSTQVPQFILETCEQRSEACRIICTQPRRLMAMSVSERIALEREETVGQR